MVYVLEIQKYVPNLGILNLGYVENFETQNDACNYYSLNYDKMRLVKSSLVTDWDGNTLLRYVVRERQQMESSETKR